MSYFACVKIHQGLAAAGLTDKEDLLKPRGTDPTEVALATSSWRRTTVTPLCVPHIGISSPLRMDHFLAELRHESGEFRYVEKVPIRYFSARP
jgi:hypothetical protein